MSCSARYHSLADLAYQAGYTDQSHFNREFKLLVGEQPSRFLAEQDAYAVNASSPPGIEELRS